MVIIFQRCALIIWFQDIQISITFQEVLIYLFVVPFSGDYWKNVPYNHLRCLSFQTNMCENIETVSDSVNYSLEAILIRNLVINFLSNCTI